MTHDLTETVIENDGMEDEDVILSDEELEEALDTPVTEGEDEEDPDGQGLDEKAHKVSPATIARLTVLALALVNQVLTMSGKNPISISEEDIYTLFTVGATVVTAIVAAYKNNSTSQHAIAADKVKDEIKKAVG